MLSKIAAAVLCIAATAASAMAVPFDRSGFILQSLDCYLFAPLSGTRWWYRIDLPSMADTSRFTLYRVIGNAVPCDQLCAVTYNDTCLVDCQVSVFPSSDLGCGVLSHPFETPFPEMCWIWTSPRYGSLVTPRHGFAAGDTVYVTGVVHFRNVPQCQVGDGYLYNEVLVACTDSMSATQGTTWGKLRFLFRR
jgi:hypothetical protein